jgi:regulator of sirC expression with transglutaminase-like and TPR domain
VYLELARRLGLREVVGIPLPGRFMVGYRSVAEDPFQILDVYERGKKMTLEEAILSIGVGSGLSERSTQPASKREIVVRMIRNLMGALTDPRAVSRETLPYLDLVIALDPEPNRERVARAMVLERVGDRRGALEDVRWVLEKGHGSLSDDQQEMLQRWVQRLSR